MSCVDACKVSMGVFNIPQGFMLPIPARSWWHHSKWNLKPNYHHQYAHLGIQYYFHY
jgi:hypothetical protein